MSEKMVLITLREYKRLAKRDVELEHLECVGVDNWSGYGQYGEITGYDGEKELEDSVKECEGHVFSSNKITILYVDDWSVMYVNGDDKYQGHEIEDSHFIGHTPITEIRVESVDGSGVEKYVIEFGRFPPTLKECEALAKKESDSMMDVATECNDDEHNWVSAKNEVVKSGEICTKCRNFR